MDNESEMDTNKKEITVKKHSAIIQMSNKVTSQQRKIFNVLIYIAKAILKKDINTQTFKTNLLTVKKLSGSNESNNKKFKESIKELTRTNVEYNILGKDNKYIWGSFVLLAGAEIKDGVLEYGFPFQVIKVIKNPNIYATLDLSIIKGLDSKYSIALYELARDYINVEIPEMPIETFRELMGIEENQYKNSNDLKKRVIDPAVKEISESEVTEITITYDLLRKGRGRKVTAIKLHVSPKNNLFKHENIELTNRELLKNELLEMKVPKKQANSLIKKHNIDVIQKNVELTKIKIANGTIDNKTGFLIDAIKNDYAKNQYPKAIESRELKAEATACWNINKGSCQAKWISHQNNKSIACHYCSRFKNQRNK